MKRYLIEIDEDLFEVLPADSEFKKGFAYCHDGLIYLYAGKAKDGEVLIPGNVYKVKDGGYSWVPPTNPEERSVEKLIDISTEKIVEDIRNDNLKEIDPILLEMSSSIFAPALREDDDVLKRVIKLILLEMKTDFKDRDKRNNYDISNVKSAVQKDAPLSWKYFMKYVEILKLDVKLDINYVDRDGNERNLIYQI